MASRLRAGPGRAGATAAAHHVLQPLGGAARSARSLAHRPTGPRSGLCGVDAHVAAGSEAGRRDALKGYDARVERR